MPHYADLYWLQMAFLWFLEWIAIGMVGALLVVALVAVLAGLNGRD